MMHVVPNGGMKSPVLERRSFSDQVLLDRDQPLRAGDITTLQVNLGYRCNMSCGHCHLSAGPHRCETMDGEVIERVLQVLRTNPVDTLDITGGSPELHPLFKRLVADARSLGKRVTIRTNLTVLSEQGNEDLPEFYRIQEVELVASLPCYRECNVNAMRGDGAFRKSIEVLRKLNRLGFGGVLDGLRLSLVYNPGGPLLPPDQATLEADYRRELGSAYGVSFTRLYALANMPIGRFRETLVRTSGLEQYLALLAAAHNPETLESVMCRSIISVGWDGRLFDCDFNQALGTPVDAASGSHVRDFDLGLLSRRRIMVGDHCYGCTAGQGSSCAGALAI